MKTNILLIGLIVVITSCNKKQATTELIKKDTPTSSIVTINQAVKADTIEQSSPEETSVILVAKHELTNEDLYVDYDGGNQLADYFSIELIGEDAFKKNRSMSVKLISTDSTIVKKEGGILKLPCNKGEVRFVDNLSDGEDHKEYTYIGTIDILNVYLLSGIYWEDWNYFFVDKNSGQITQYFNNYPYLLANGKSIISLDFDTFEGTAYIDLYEVSNKNIDPTIGMYIKRWIPIGTSESIYTGNDNYLYIPVINTRDYWVADGKYTGLSQYIRLKPLI